MAITRQKKEELLNIYKNLIQQSESIFFIDSQQVKTEDLLGLKEKLRDQNCTYKLIKNTLFKKVWEEETGETLENFSGYNGAIFCSDNSTAAGAKELAAFINTTKQGLIKNGIIAKTQLQKEDIIRLSKLPSKDQMLQQVLSLLNHNLTRFVMDLNSPLQKLSYILSQIQTK